MDPAKYVYKSDFARSYITVGREEAVMDQLAVKFGPLSDDVKNRLGAASVTELGAIGCSRARWRKPWVSCNESSPAGPDHIAGDGCV